MMSSVPDGQRGQVHCIAYEEINGDWVDSFLMHVPLNIVMHGLMPITSYTLTTYWSRFFYTWTNFQLLAAYVDCRHL